MKQILKYISILFLIIFSTGESTAQNSNDIISQNLTEITLGLAAIVCILVLIVLVVVLGVLKAITNRQKLEAEEAAIERGEAPATTVEHSLWNKIIKDLTDAVPIEKEEDVLTDHVYDGIRELDNNLPPWWKYMFYLTILFSVVYLLHYHVFSTGPSSIEEYEMEMKAAAAQTEAYQATLGETINENNVAFSDDPAILDEGRNIFVMQCAVCHANDGGGGIGPNFTDEYWINGGSINDIFRTIKEGVPQKGMISWKTILSPTQIQAVASYITTLKGTTPALPKEAQGELYTPVE